MITTLTGDNRHQLKQALGKIVNRFESKHGSLAVERFSAEESSAEQILHALTAVTLLSQEKLVIIEDFESFKDLAESIDDWLDKVPETTDLVLVINKLDKRLGFVKLLQKSTDFQEFKPLDSHNAVGWVAKEVLDRAGQIDQGTAQYLVDCVGPNQALLSNEIDKLILFNPKVTRESIDLLSERQLSSSVFDLLDAGFGGQGKKALSLYEDQRRQRIEPLYIVSMIGWQLHILALVKTAKGKAPNDIAKQAGMHPFVIQKSSNLIRRITLTKLKQLVHQAVELEIMLKSRSTDADDAVKHFLLSLATS